MSDQFNRGGKNDGNRKFQSINLSQHFNKRDYKTAAKSTTGRGLQSLGKVSVSTRRLPRPAVCSSLKKENAGNDPNVALVPGSGGWASKKESSSTQVEANEGERGWKDVPEKTLPGNKQPGFSQHFPSLGEEAPSERLELRPQTGKWGEKKLASNDMPTMPESAVQPPLVPQIPQPINQTFGVVQVPMSPMYGMVPVPGPIYAGMAGPLYRHMYPGTAPPQLYTGTPPGVPPLMPYMYAAPPTFHKIQDKEQVKVTPDKNRDKVAQGPDHWGDDVMGPPPTVIPKMAAASDVVVPTGGYISPYTQPFPGKFKPDEPAAVEPVPVGKPADDKRITYHGRTSSHSSLSEPLEDDIHNEFEDKLDINKTPQQGTRVISRTIVKKELKAFPKEDELENTPKAILQKSPRDHDNNDQMHCAWDEDIPENEKRSSVWEERKKQQESKQPNAWQTSQPSTSDRFFEDDYDPEEAVSPKLYEDEQTGDRMPHRHDHRDRDYNNRDRDRSYDNRSKERSYDNRSRRDPRDSRERDRSGQSNRRFMDSAQRKAIEETSDYINSMPRTNNRRQPPVLVQQKPVLEILQNPDKRSPPQSNTPVSGNYWQEKQAERDRKEAEEEQVRHENQKEEAQKARQHQYQDYRTPDQYSLQRDEDEDPQQQYEEEREKERHGIRRRAQDEFYDYDPDVKYERPERKDRGEHGEKVHRYREERSRSDYRDSREYKRRDPWDSREERSQSDYRRYNSRDYYDDRSYYREPVEKPRRQERSRKPARYEQEQEPDEDLTPEVEDEGELKSSEVTQAKPPRADHRECEFVPEKSQPKSRNDKQPRERTSREKSDRYDRKERYNDRDRYDRADYSYRRDPRDNRERRRGSRDSRDKRERNPPRSEPEGTPKDEEYEDEHVEEAPKNEKPTKSKAKERVERYKSEKRERTVRQDRDRQPRRHREEEDEWFSSDEYRIFTSKSFNNNTRSRLCKAPGSELVDNVDEEQKRPERGERPPRRGRKAPSVRYYSANPADRAKSQHSHSAPPQTSDKNHEKPHKERTNREKGDKTKSKENKPKKESVGKREQPDLKTKAVEPPTKSKDKENGNAIKKTKKTEQSKIEMDRLKKMTQCGMDLLTIGIYAVDGKELDDQEIEGDTEGFVEVVRKKNKKDPEPEKVEKKTGSSSKSKKTKKADRTKKSHDSTEPINHATPPVSSAANPAVTKNWTNGVDASMSLVPNIWSNRKNVQNAWDKPLTFTEKQSLETREMLAPLSGESTSLFSSDADLAKKTKEKDKYLRNDSRPPRFSKIPDKTKTTSYRSEKKRPKEPALARPVDTKNHTKTLDVIPPGVEDLFGLRSDGEEDKPTLSSLVLENKISSPLGTSPTVGLPPRLQPPEDKLNMELSKPVQHSPELVDRSAETSTQTTPPAKPLEEKRPTPPVPIEEVSVVSPPRPVSLDPVVDQLITSTGGLSLTDQLREIGQAAQPERLQFFGIQGSPLIQGLSAATLHNEPPMTPPTQQPLLGHFMPSDVPQSPHLTHLNSPTSIPLMSSHPISSPLSSLGNMVGQQRSTDFLKNYMSPMSPTNKMYPSATNQNILNQNLHTFMSGTFMSGSGNYVSPSMSPIPSQINPFAQFQKSTSPKLHHLYNNTGNSMVEGLDPTIMLQHSVLNKSSNALNLNNQQLFYQRMMPTEMYYKMKQTDNILLQSDMSKHVDAKPFNPGGPHPGGPHPGGPHPGMPHPGGQHQQHPSGHHVEHTGVHPGTHHQVHPGTHPGAHLAPRPGMFKPELLHQAVLQQHSAHLMSGHHMQGYKQHNMVDSRLSRPEPKPEPMMQSMSLQRAPPTDMQNVEGHTPSNMQQVPGIFTQQPRQEPTFLQQPTATAMMMRPQRAMPRVKLARDGRLHRIPDVRNKFSTLIPPSVQQHMQQQSLAQIQQYTAAINRGEDPAKETLPDNMKPGLSPVKAAPPSAPPPDLVPEEKNIVDDLPKKEEVMEEEEMKMRSSSDEERGSEKRKVEKRKYNEVRSSYRRRDYDYGYHEYPAEYYDYDPNYREERYRYRGYAPTRARYPPPPHMYRGPYPPPPPREYRRGHPPPRGRHRY